MEGPVPIEKPTTLHKVRVWISRKMGKFRIGGGNNR